jgi:spore coat polysaccharide biosynthesis predicted glycosyltransferase SpsG
MFYIIYINTTYKKYLKYLKIILNKKPNASLYYSHYVLNGKIVYYLPDKVYVFYENFKYLKPIIKHIMTRWAKKI